MQGIFSKNKILYCSLAILIVVICYFAVNQHDPNSLHGLLEKGEELESEGRVAHALEHYTRVVRAYPASYEGHIRLGRLYAEVREPDKAKVEYYRAMNLGEQGRHDAYLALAELYALNGSYDLAEKFLASIQDTKVRRTVVGLGDFYYKWGKYLERSKDSTSKDRLEAIRKYKIAYKFYKKAKAPARKEVKHSIDIAYARIADELLATDHKIDAIKILNISLKYEENAVAHYKLARIFENDNIDKALEHYEHAFKLNHTIAKKDRYADLLAKRAEQLKLEGEETRSKYYFYLAHKMKPESKVVVSPDNEIMVSLLSAKLNDNKDDTLTPGIVVKVTNLGASQIEDLKLKVVFYKDEEHLAEKVETIVDAHKPLSKDGSTSKIVIYSPATVHKAYVDQDIKVQIFVYNSKAKDWKLYRTANVIES